MDFALTPEQEMLRDTARAVLAETSPMSRVRTLAADPRGTDDETWRRMAALGWQGMIFPEAYGGAGLGMLELALVLGEMGRALLPGPFLSTILGGLAILHGGDEAQRRRWLPGVCDGTRVATLAILEASTRWDLDGVAAEARPAGARVALAGTKLFVPDAHVADVLVCALRRAGEGTPVLVAVERDAPGLRLEPLPGVDGTRKIFAVGLDGVEVAADRMLAGDGAGTLARVLDEGRAALAAETCGGAERVLELTVAYAKTREQFGRPIGSFQAIQHRCADMMVAVECAKVAALYAAWALAAGAGDAPLAAAMAKATADEAYGDVTRQAIQVHGGIGFTWEHDLHLYFRRALASTATFGDAAWNRELVAQRLGL